MTVQHTYTTLSSEFYTTIESTPFLSIKTLQWNETLASELQLPYSSDNALLQGLQPHHTYIAQAYAGHQYGHFTMLGDGRAMLIGEWQSKNTLFDLQLKGSGPTPYSRRGDGKATLQSMLREYIISEAMHHLGVPTTRSLAVYLTGEQVYREQQHQGAMLLRVASSHIRVGTFEYARGLDEIDKLQQLADYTIERHYPFLKTNHNKYLGLFEEVTKRQAKLVAQWQSIGFVHGVLNTDNVSLSGETIDYGPCAFLDEYNPSISFSSIDRHNRYAYFRQPYITSWNLSKLAVSLLPLIDPDPNKGVERLNTVLDQFQTYFEDAYRSFMGRKIGLAHATKEDMELITELLSMMETHHADFTNTFVTLTKGTYDQLPFSHIEWSLWYDKWQTRLLQDTTLDAAQKRMKQANPIFIPRNHLVQSAVDQADFQSDFKEFERLLNLVQDPYNYDKDHRDTDVSPNPSNQQFVSYCGT